MVCINQEKINKHVLQCFTTVNHYSQHICIHMVSQHSYSYMYHETASLSVPTGDSWQMCDNFLSV